MTTANMTTAAIQAAIEDWYTQAGQALGLIRHLSRQADDRLIHSVSCFASDAGDPPTKEQVDQLFVKLLDDRKAISERLRRDVGELWWMLHSLDSFTRGPIWSRFEIAYCELGDFQVGNYSGGRAAAAVLIPLGHDVRRWTSELADLWSEDIIDAADTKLAKTFEGIRGRCPFTTEIDNAIRQRLMLEKSQLLRDLLKFPISNCESGSGDESAATEQKEPVITGDPARQPPAFNKPCHGKAFLAAQYAEMQAGRQLTDCEAWDWLREHGTEEIPGLVDYDLPGKDTFADYLTKARKAAGEPRKSSRLGFTPRSAVKWSGLD